MVLKTVSTIAADIAIKMITLPLGSVVIQQRGIKKRGFSSNITEHTDRMRVTKRRKYRSLCEQHRAK